MKLMALIVVFAGGGLGSVIRFTLSRMVVSFRYTAQFPLATFLANVMACMVMVTVFYFSWKPENFSENRNLFWLVGFCGGLSTFSTFSYENWLLLRDGFYITCALNIILSIAVCVLLFALAGKYLIAPN